MRQHFDLFQDELWAAFAVRPWYRRIDWWIVVGWLAMGLSALTTGWLLMALVQHVLA